MKYEVTVARYLKEYAIIEVEAEFAEEAIRYINTLPAEKRDE